MFHVSVPNSVAAPTAYDAKTFIAQVLAEHKKSNKPRDDPYSDQSTLQMFNSNENDETYKEAKVSISITDTSTKTQEQQPAVASNFTLVTPD